MTGEIRTSKEVKLWKNKPLWLFYVYQMKPQEGQRPDAESFVKIEEQYAIFYKDSKGMDGPTKLKEPDMDRALDRFNDKLKEWKDGCFEARSTSILVNEDCLEKIKEVEAQEGFTKWLQESLVEDIKDFV